MVKIEKSNLKNTEANLQLKKRKSFKNEKKNHSSEEEDEEKNERNVKNKKRKISNNIEMNKDFKQIPTIKANHLYRAPTVDEINQLRETENLFHSNLFRMQIDEMLKEIKVKEKYKSYIKTWLDEFNTFLLDLKSMSTKEESTNLLFLKKCTIKPPIDLNSSKSKSFQFQFLKPKENAFLIGSTDFETLIGPELKVDICILIPAEFFQKDNHLNLIYDKKRALYLTYIAWKMHKTKKYNIKFNYFKNNSLKSILEVIPNDKIIGKRLIFRIFVSPEINSFKLSRFVPWNSNIRESLFKKLNPNDELLMATPNYNSMVLFDLTMEINQNYGKEVFEKHINFKDGLKLLKIWLQQRNLDAGYSGFNSHIMTMLILYLFKEKKLHTSMSSYQVLRNVWNFLANSSWNEENKGIRLNNSLDKNQPTLEQFHTYYDIVFIDSTGFLNLCSYLSLDIYLRVKFESQRAIELLNNTKINSFQALFMQKIKICINFDHILQINKEAVITKILEDHGKKSDLVNFAGLWYPQLLKMITELLRKGLDKRVLSITPIEQITNSWNVKETPPQVEKSFKLGIILNEEMAFEILDKGPQANESSCQKFRDFWGDMSELRRFQDGSITEACVWSSPNEILTEKRLIVKKIIYHLLRHHFNVLPNDIDYAADQFDFVYKLNSIFYVFEDGNKDSESTTLDLIKSFDELGKFLRALDDLPLDITSVRGVSSVFRYCEPVPILGQARTYQEGKKLIFQAYKVCDAVLQLGVSGKWPNDLNAFRRMKTAFHIQIAKSLRTQFKLETRAEPNAVYILKDGYIFKIEIAHQKEIALMKKLVTTKGITEYNDTPESLELEKRFTIIPKLTSTLHGLYQRYTSFGPTVMIAKRWLYSQLIDPFLWPNECTELLIASQFLKMELNLNPCQPQCGFFRFLFLLANTDWRNELILINFNDEMPYEEVTQLENNFNTDRDSMPPLSIVTSYDSSRTGIWSSTAPSIQVLSRVTILARHALNIIEENILHVKSLFAKNFFTPSFDGYNIIIHLRPQLVHTCHAYDFESENIEIDATIPAAEFNPVEKGLSELREAFADIAIFFYNPCGGKEIAVIWKPIINVENEFKISDLNGHQIKNDKKIIYNVEQFIEDFKIILKGLYLEIEIKN